MPQDTDNWVDMTVVRIIATGGGRGKPVTIQESDGERTAQPQIESAVL